MKTPVQIKLRNTFLPFGLSRTSFIVCIGNLSRTIASLALCTSTHNRMSPDGFGATSGLIHVVGLSTLSIMSFSRSSSTLAVILSLPKNEILHIFWTTGVTWGSMCSFNWYFFNLPTLNTPGNLALRLSTKGQPTVLQLSARGLGAGPMWRIPGSVAIEFPTRHRPCLNTIKCVKTFVSSTANSDLNRPTNWGVWPPQAYNFLLYNFIINRDLPVSWC